jgi:hypothetical protein
VGARGAVLSEEIGGDRRRQLIIRLRYTRLILAVSDLVTS